MATETLMQLSNKIYKILVEEGFSGDYAEQSADFAESQGREYCLQMLKEL